MYKVYTSLESVIGFVEDRIQIVYIFTETSEVFQNSFQHG